MYNLVKVNGSSYYIEAPAKVGLVRLSENDVFLIDSGNDKDAAKKVLKIIDSEGWNLKFIINTHSHADHIGGNKFLQDRTGCKIYAKGAECDLTNNPVLESAILYGGYPPEELRKKFFLAQKSQVDYLSQDVLPVGFEIIPLKGHYFDMVGIKTSDNVLYIADSFSGKDILDKYKIGYIYDVGAYIETLEMLKNVNADYFVPSHTVVSSEISDIIQYNIDSVKNIAEIIYDLCNEAKCFDDLIKNIFDFYELKMSFEQYSLVGSTLKSYLSWLKYEGRISLLIENNKVLWKSV